MKLTSHSLFMSYNYVGHGTNVDGLWLRPKAPRGLQLGSIIKFGASSRTYTVSLSILILARYEIIEIAKHNGPVKCRCVSPVVYGMYVRFRHMTFMSMCSPGCHVFHVPLAAMCSSHVFPWAALIAGTVQVSQQCTGMMRASILLILIWSSHLSAPLVCPGFWTVIVIRSKVCHMFINPFNLCTVPPALANISTGMRDFGLCH